MIVRRMCEESARCCAKWDAEIDIVHPNYNVTLHCCFQQQSAFILALSFHDTASLKWYFGFVAPAESTHRRTHPLSHSLSLSAPCFRFLCSLVWIKLFLQLIQLWTMYSTYIYIYTNKRMIVHLSHQQWAYACLSDGKSKIAASSYFFPCL